MKNCTSTFEAKQRFFQPHFGDSRLTERFNRVIQDIQDSPNKSFPEIFSSKAKLDGFYRLMNNERVTFDEIMKLTYEDTVQSIKERNLVLAIHDTTAFSFSGVEPIEGLGRLHQKKGNRGFFGHFCVAATLQREIIGILGLAPWVRSGEQKGRRSRDETRTDETNERRRWLRLIREVDERSAMRSKVVHVADREADDYVTFSEMTSKNMRFVFRTQYNRVIKDAEYSKLFDSLKDAPTLCEIEVPISLRKKKRRPNDDKLHPPRKKRKAKLSLCAKAVAIERSGNATKDLPRCLTLNFVKVTEVEPPTGEVPISWTLMTTEPVNTSENLLKIVNIYCARWTIEEFFKSLKTGCAFEKRGFQSYHAILNCLSIMAPIAYKIYNLKIIGREHPDSEATLVLNSDQVQVLAHVTKKKVTELTTAGAAMLAVAALGGHLKHNGLPGWQVLARGYEKLLSLEQGFVIAKELKNSKQSLAGCNM
jgi:hypothetical protein